MRDELLGLTPADYDIATDATPDRVRALFPRSSEVGASFGVVLVHIDGGVIEVATFRSDGDYSDHRRPDSVRFSTPEEDAQRRDYTVNALFLDPLSGWHGAGVPRPTRAGQPSDTARVEDAPCRPQGAVIDFVDGQRDLAARTLRAVGDPDQRLAEDHLRALRAVRLAARLNFTIDPATAAAIRRHAAALQGVSRERIGDEVERILSHPTRAEGARLLHELGLETPVFAPWVPPRSAWGLRLSLLPANAAYPTALAAWALDLGLSGPGDIEPLVAAWRAALCLSNDARDDLAATLRGVFLLAGTWPALSVAGQKRAAAAPWFNPALEVFTAQAPDAAAAARRRRDELAATPGGLAPTPLVTGDDLIAIGLTPGPGFKPLLDRLYDEQLEGRVTNSEQARELARRLSVEREGLA